MAVVLVFNTVTATYFAPILLLGIATIYYIYGPLWSAQARRIIFNLPRLPPGTMGLPYWGESKRYVNSWNNVANPDVFYRERGAKYGKVFRTSLYGEPTIVLLGPQGNKFIYDNEHRLFRSDWPLNIKEFEGVTTTTMLVGSKEHSRMRRALHSCFSAEAVRSYTSKLENAIVTHLQHNWEGNVKAYDLLESLMVEIFANCFLSLEIGSKEMTSFINLWNLTLTGYSTMFKIPLPWSQYGKARKARQLLLESIYNEMAARRKGVRSPTGDILERFMALDNPALSDMEIAENVHALHNTGFTTAGASMIVLKHIAADPVLQIKLRQECRSLAASKRGERVTWEDLRDAPFLNSILNEGLRIQAPMFGTFKRALKDIVFDGFLIPKGWRVHNNIRMTHNNSEFYENPTKFDPSRFSSLPDSTIYTPFGGGVRVCPGKEFGLSIMRLFFYHIMLKYELELQNPDEEMMVYLFPAPREGLPMRIRSISE